MAQFCVGGKSIVIMENDPCSKGEKTGDFFRKEEPISRASEETERQEKVQEMRFHFNTGKAGMDDPVQKNVNEVVEKVLKGTAYYKRQQEKQAENAKKVEFYKAKLAAVYQDQKLYAKLKKEYEAKIKDLTKNVDLTRQWIHIDLDMFYVAIELRDNPSLADKPVAVGSSVLSTSNYIARKFGVRSAMPSHVAKLLCPSLILLPVNMNKYKEASDKFMSIVEEYDPEFETMGLDEAKLDITEYLENHNIEPTKENLEKIMNDIRQRINFEIKITASCGCAPNPLLAKLCSEKAKPNGQRFLEADQTIIEEFVGELDVRKIPGIGPQSEDVLKGLGIMTALDMRSRLFDLFVIYNEYERFIDYARDCHGIAVVISFYSDYS